MEPSSPPLSEKNRFRDASGESHSGLLAYEDLAIAVATHEIQTRIGVEDQAHDAYDTTWPANSS